MQVYNIRKVAF